MTKIKMAFDIDVGLIKVWKEKRDKRIAEAEEFFRFLQKNKNKFSVVVSKHTLDMINEWKHKVIVQRLEKLYHKHSKKAINPEKYVKKFIFELKTDFDKISSRFAKKAEIKEEDAITIIIYSLLGVEYFVTFNRKHLRNKYEKIKTAGWKYGLKIPEIMLPNEFVTFFSRRFSS